MPTLKLSRKPGESILIDGQIRLHIESTTGGRVRLAITAPAEVLILREELQSNDADDFRDAA